MWNPLFNNTDIFTRNKIDCANFEKNKDKIKKQAEQLLNESGFCIFSNTDIKESSQVMKYFSLIVKENFSYEGGSFARKKLADNVYDTGCPNYCLLAPHIEMSYNPVMPKYLSLTCLESPHNGTGATMFSDNVSITKKMLKTKLGQKLKNLGIRHYRRLHSDMDKTYPDAVKYSSWQVSYETNSKEKVEEYLRKSNQIFSWGKNDMLSIINPQEAYMYYEKTDSNLLFFGPSNHASMFDSYSVDFQKLDDDLRAFTLKFGDDSEFTNDEVLELHKFFDEDSYQCFYEEGEMMIIDNMMWQHGRLPFAVAPGKTRNIAVTLGDKYFPDKSRDDKWYPH